MLDSFQLIDHDPGNRIAAYFGGGGQDRDLALPHLVEEPATLAELEVGAVMPSINGKPLANTGELRSVLARFMPGDSGGLRDRAPVRIPIRGL